MSEFASDVRLDHANTFGLPILAHRVATVTSELQLERLLTAYAPCDPLVILGGGSNVICAPVIDTPVCLMRLRGLRLLDGCRIEAAAGENWHDVVRFSVGQGLSGLEHLALIPGSVGAAPVQNIGAYGASLADVIETVLVFDRRQGQQRWLSRAECAFGYRDSVFKRSADVQRYVILRVRMTLRSDHALTATLYDDVSRELALMGVPGHSARQRFEAVVRVRRRKLPDVRRYGNVGSVFKNPLVSASQLDELMALMPDVRVYREQDGGIKVPAAALIDGCGWRGRRLTGVWCWPRQALVLVNAGVRDGHVLRDVMSAIAADVYRSYGIRLEPEPQFIGL